MPKDKRQVAVNRQKKIAKQKAKRKEALRVRNAHPQGVPFERRFGYTRQEIRAGEIGLAWVPKGLFGEGIGTVVVTRELPDGVIAAGVFLVDVWCLGVKNAFLRLFDDEMLEQFIADLSKSQTLERVEVARAAKLIAEAIDYARRLDFHPHRDYGDASVVLHGIDTSRCHDAFVFGREGMPCYASGPHETFEKSRAVIGHLDKVCGKGNFHFIIGESLFHPGFDDDFDEDEDSEDEAREDDARNVGDT